MTKGRLEAFSDGVFAIAITLLVLDLKVPQNVAIGGLLPALCQQWPAYFAYLVSFLIVGIVCLNHHGIFDKVKVVDRTILLLNLFLLLSVSLIPFPTRLVSEYLSRGPDAQVAVSIYSAVMLGMALANGWIWLHITGSRHLMHEHLDRVAHRAAIRRFGVGSIFYLMLVFLSFLSPIGTLVVHALVALYYCFDHLSANPRRLSPSEPQAGI
jgi:uncharacterized membrane protein